jgi:hypothetical protein
MKKLYTLLVYVLIFCIAAHAQKRYVDIKLSLDSPRNNQSVMPGSFLAINTILTNLGPDTLYATDSIALLIFDASGNVVVYHDGTKPAMYYHGFPAQKLIPGDTMHLKGPSLPIELTVAPGAIKYCIRAVPYRDSINEMWYPAKQNLSDTGINGINNDSCVTINVLSVSVNDVPTQDFSGVHVYPNPTYSFASFNIDLLKGGNLNISLTDMTGRVVLSEQKINLPKGRQVMSINTAHLNRGIYLYKVSMGQDVVTGKLRIE